MTMPSSTQHVASSWSGCGVAVFACIGKATKTIALGQSSRVLSHAGKSMISTRGPNQSRMLQACSLKARANLCVCARKHSSQFASGSHGCLLICDLQDSARPFRPFSTYSDLVVTLKGNPIWARGPF